VSLVRRLAVFHRLYQQAVALRQKMEMRRDNVIKDELDSLAQHKTNMSWISSEMMRDRSAGPFGNYGEMLYAESLESLARKRDRVSGAGGAAGVGVVRRGVGLSVWTPGECMEADYWKANLQGWQIRPAAAVQLNSGIRV
jgi:hypothetical protein